MPDPSAGEVGGVFAGAVALLAVLGKGLKYLFGRADQRELTRSEKLNAWHGELDKRERDIDERQAAYQATIERKLQALTIWATRIHAEHSSLRSGYQLIASALRAIDEGNPALRMADDLLRSAFPLDPLVPPDFTDLLADIPEDHTT